MNWRRRKDNIKEDIFITDKKFKIIYADPPWQYKTYSEKGKSRSAERHYPTMSKKEIQQLPVGRIADENSVLFLWVTAPFLEEGIELIRTWGFTYKTIAFTWVKKNKRQDSFFIGMGYYTRANAEFCLLATKGKILKRCSRSVSSLICSRIEQHSKKPDEARKRIVRLFGDIPRIELFAREYENGWSCWGNEV